MNLLKNTNLLSHCSVGQKSGHSVTGLCAQGLTRLDQVWTGLRFYLSLGVLLKLMQVVGRIQFLLPVGLMSL